MKALIVLLALAVASYAYQDCDVEGLDINGWSVTNDEPIKDDFRGTFLTLNATGITGVKVDRPKYINVAIDNEKIIFYTTEKYKDVEYEMKQSIKPKIEFEITFFCEAGDSSTIFIQPIEDINNHVPDFNRELYTYKFGMNGVAKGFDLNELLDIVAVDVDLTDTQVDFSIEEQDFLGIKGLSSSNKIFRARLTTLKELVGPMDKNFTIKAKDTRSEEVGTAIVNVILL